LGVAIDWARFDVTLPTGERRGYQALRIAVPRRGRAIPCWSSPPTGAASRPTPARTSSRSGPCGRSSRRCRRACARSCWPTAASPRATVLTWLGERRLDYVVRIDQGMCVTEPDGRRWKLGQAGLRLGERGGRPGVRSGRRHDRPRALRSNLARCWRIPRREGHPPHRQPPTEPWRLATSLAGAGQAAAWYRQRFWIEESVTDSHSGVGLDRVRVGCPARLTRRPAALALALAWLTLLGLPEVRALPPGWHAEVAQWGRASVISLALARLAHRGDLPPACLPPAT
jgi:hypothetical protein